jgi:hypothetical protein
VNLGNSRKTGSARNQEVNLASNFNSAVTTFIPTLILVNRTLNTSHLERLDQMILDLLNVFYKNTDTYISTVIST